MSKPIRVVLAIVLLAMLAVVLWFAVLRSQPAEASTRIAGNIELTEVNIAFKTPGRLEELHVKEGDLVKAGQLIGRLDTQQLQSQRQMAEAALTAAQSRLQQLATAIRFQEETIAGVTAQREAELAAVGAQLEELEEGSRPQERQQAHAALQQAEAEFARAQADWQRAQALHAAEDISTAERDRVRAYFASAQSMRDQARERLAMVEEGPRVTTIRSVSAQVDRARAALRTAQASRLDLERLRQELNTRQQEVKQATANLELIETQIADASVHSPVDGIVLVKSAEQGEVLAAGVTIATVGNLASPWLRGYLAQQHQGRVQLGAPVRVYVDSYPGRAFDGRLSFIAAEAEFTPKQIQTAEERAKLVYRVKVDIPNPDGALKANMPAEADLPLLPVER